MFNLTNKTRDMDKEELKEVMGLLRAAGMKAMLCDTPVAVSAAGVPCGCPAELGDECIEDYYLLPKALVGLHPMMLVPADGDTAAFNVADTLTCGSNIEFSGNITIKVSSGTVILAGCRSDWGINYEFLEEWLQLADEGVEE